MIEDKIQKLLSFNFCIAMVAEVLRQGEEKNNEKISTLNSNEVENYVYADSVERLVYFLISQCKIKMENIVATPSCVFVNDGILLRLQLGVVYTFDPNRKHRLGFYLKEDFDKLLTIYKWFRLYNLGMPETDIEMWES